MTQQVYEIVTDQIVKLLEAGTVPWRKPWTLANRPRNIDSNKPYRGINVMILASQGFSSPYWMTFNQAKKHGGTIKKGEHGTIVIFWKLLESNDPKDVDEKGKRKQFAMLRYYKVFNLDQTENVKVPNRPVDQVREDVDPIEAAELIVQGYPNPPKILENGYDAHYEPEADKISIPSKKSFHTAEARYAALFHEMGHSTGHTSRLDRPIQNIFGSHPYGREELIAEMTAAFLCGESGIAPAVIDNSAAYLASWIKTIKEDLEAVIKAASAAQKAADLILDHQE